MLTSPSARRTIPVRLCDLPENVVKPRYYVHEAHGFRIETGTSSVGGRSRALPVCFYVLDRDDNHRPVGQFPLGVFWHSRGRTFEKARRDAFALCAQLNAEDIAEAAA